MQNERRQKSLQSPSQKMRLMDSFMILIIILNLLILYIAVDVLSRSLNFSSIWDNIVVICLTFLAIGSIFLVTMLRVLHRSIGAIRRIEGVLRKFVEGDYSLRIQVRKRDYLHELAITLNRLLDIVEGKSKN